MAATTEEASVAVPAPAPAPTPTPTPAVEASKAEAEPPKIAEAVEGPCESSPQFSSFKEESNFVSDLKESEKKALQELKVRVEEAIKSNEFTHPPPKPDAKTEPEAKEGETTQAKEGEKDVEEVKKIIIETEETQLTTEEAPAAVIVEDKPAASAEQGQEKSVAGGGATETVEEAPAEQPKPAEAEYEGKVIEVEAVEVKASEEDVKAEDDAVPPPEDVYLWGIPLLPSKGDERTDVVLLKFLRARDFKVKEAFTMLKNTVLWRKSFGADNILDEDLGTDLDGVAYMHGYDKEGHPVCYNVFGVFQNKELYQKTFSDEAKRDKFLRWRVQLLEKGFQFLSFSPGGISSMVQITDLKNSPGPSKRELRQATNQALSLLQDNYPEFVAKKIFINVPWWYLALNTMISPFVTLRTRSKFVIARPARVTETLFKYISPEQVPVQYGGLSRENDSDFSAADGVSEEMIKAGAKHIVEIPVTDVGSTLVWDLVVVGWEVSYGAEFVPSAEAGYTVIIQKAKKFSMNEEAVRNSFKIGEPGKVLLTMENTSSRRKKLLYRSKVKSA